MTHILRRSFAAVVLVAACSTGASAQGTITTIAGTGTSGFSGDGGAAVSATLSSPHGVALDASGNIYIADLYNGRVRKIDATTGIISTFAGGGSSYADGIVPTTGHLWQPWGVSVNSVNDVLITDHFHDMTFYVSHTTGLMAARCGCHSQGCSGDDGPGTGAKFELPTASCEDGAGNTYVADFGCSGLRKVNGATGIVTSLSTSAGPLALYFDQSTTTDLYVAESYNHRVVKVNVATGVTTVVAGTGAIGYSGDGGDAASATLGSPTGLYIDNAHNLYISDATYNVVRRVRLLTGTIHTIAGNGTAGYSGDNGPSPYAQLNSPQGLWGDASGYLYIADAGNNVIRKVKPKGLKSNGTAIAATEVSVYPNPSNGSFTLASGEDLENAPVTVFDVTGRQVYSTTVSGDLNVINIGQQPTGVYTLVLKTANGTSTQKLTIQ